MEIEDSNGASRWGAWLPPDIKAEEESTKAREQHEAWMQHVVIGLARSIAAGDVAGSSGRYWVRAIQTHVFDLRRPVPDETRTQLVQLLYNAITMHHTGTEVDASTSSSRLDPTLQSKWAGVLTRLLKKWKNLAGSVMTLPWRPLYDTLLEAYTHGLRQPAHHATAIHAYRVSTLVSLAKKARRFFPAGAAQEIQDTIRPFFCPHDNSSTFKAQALLCLFVPSSSFDRQLVAEVFEKWAWIERSGQWDANWISLLARFAKVSHSSAHLALDWTPYLPQLFTHVLRILDVSTAGASKLPKPGHHKAPSETHVFTPHEKETKIANMAKLLIYILTPSTPSQLSVELQSLRHLFRSIESYFYPSNSGGWSDVLGLFLRSIAHHYAERVGKERRRGLVPQDRQLTDADHKALIALLDEPLKQAIYGKGNIPSAAAEAIRHLAYIEPGLLFPSLLHRVYSALESLTATHQTVNAIETLTAICHPLLSRKNYPVGAHHLPQLLRLTLPGIDANDRRKTMATYAFYAALFSHVPLFDASGVPAENEGKRRKQREEADADSAAKDATAVFSEWSVELLETLFSVLRNQDKPSNEHYDQAVRSFFKKMVELFFQQLSPQIYTTLSKKLLHFVTYNVVPNATKEFGFLVASASLANPEAALKTYLPLCYKKIIKLSKETGAATLKDRSDDEMKWYLHLLASVVKRTGPALVPHVDKLRTVITECFASNKKALAKAAGKLLRNVLYTLSQYYPTDFRSAPPAVWNSEEFDRTHWKTWGQQGDASVPTVQWHQPTETELQLASDLVAHLLPDALRKLQSLSSDSNALGKDELWVVLQQVRSIVRGAATILPQEKGSHEPREQWDAELPHREQPPSVTYPSHLWQSIAEGRNGQVRSDIAQALSAASRVFKTSRADDITSLAKLLKLMNLVLNFNGISQEKLRWKVAIYKGVKRRYAKKLEAAADKQDAMDIEEEAEKEKQEKQHYRRILIDRAHIEYLARVNQTNWHNDVGEAGKQLLHHLYDFATFASGYAGVRKKAQGALHNAWKYRPFSRHMFLHNIIAKLSDKSVGEDELKGNAFLLFNRGVIRLISREWRYLAPFLVSIASSHVHSNEKLQTLLYQLFVLYSVSSYPVPLAAPSPPAVLPPGAGFQLSADTLQRAAKEIEFHNKKNVESYNNALRDLLAIAEDPALHWRYQVISYACILFLVRPDPLPSLQVVRLFLRGTVNELQPLRTLSRKALSILLKIYKPHFSQQQGSTHFTYGEYRANAVRAHTPLTRDEWSNTTFVDNNWEGWNADVFTGDVRPSQRSASAASDEAIQHVADELAGFLDDPLMRQQFLHYLAQDHHVRADEAEGKSQDHSHDMVKQLSSILGSALGRSALSGRLGNMGKSLVAQAANEVLRELLKQNKHWPYVANKVPSSSPNSFVVENAQLFKGLFQLSLARGNNRLATNLFDAHLRPFLDAFLRNEEGTDASGRVHAGDQERSHALAAEIMSGAMRCLKYGGYDYAERLWNYWIPFLERIIAQAPTDCVRNWFIAIRFGVYNLDVRRVVPLGDLLVRQLQTLTADTKKEGDSLRDAKVLQFVQPFLAETTWRAADYNRQVLGLLASRISSPFKQVRSELSYLLVLVFRNLWHNPAVAGAARGGSDDAISAFFAAIPARVYKMKTTADVDADVSPPKRDDGDAMDEEGQVRSTPAEDTSHAREALLLTLWHATKTSASGAIAPYVHHFLRLLFASLGDEDRDTVNVAKQCAALAAQMILPEQAPRSSFVEHLLALPKPDTLWHTRAAMLPFLQIFLFNHRFLLNEEERRQVRELVISLLADARVEVRELASVSLSSLLHGEEDAQVTSLAQRFLATLGQPLRRRDLKNAPEERLRHGAALGLAAIVQSVTYTVPAWLPPLLVSLAPYEDDAHSSVKDAMKKSFAEFHRTHQEAWELHQEAFTEEQLSVVVALGKTPTSYYL